MRPWVALVGYIYECIEQLSIGKAAIGSHCGFEHGRAALAGAGRSELGVEFLLKKPFTLSQNTELMLGLGPESVRTTFNGVRTTQHAAEFLLDFQFWQTRNIG